jgi:hypothetical protein
MIGAIADAGIKLRGLLAARAGAVGRVRSRSPFEHKIVRAYRLKASSQ